jgi:phosphoglucomutase/phosphomannomutase
VAQSVQGHCNYLKAKNIDSGIVVVAYDTRLFVDLSKTYSFLGEDHPLLGLTSAALAVIAAEIYAGNGFEVAMHVSSAQQRYLTTPELSFTIRFMNAVGGINVSASHNHPDDNGFKFFNSQGAQDVPPVDQELTSFMHGISDVRRTSLHKDGAGKRLLEIPDHVHAAYVKANLELPRGRNSRAVTIAYTPLCGTGDSSVGDVLRAAGYDVKLFPAQANFDGTFASVPLRLPNPEVPDAGRPVVSWARDESADLVLLTDPDADRIGVFAKTVNESWRHFTGNEIACILAYYLLLDDDLGPKRTGFLVKTLVTTQLLDAIARKAGCPIVSDLLVGFKYIANVLHVLEQTGRFAHLSARPHDLVLAAEESHGVLLTAAIRDKDAAGGALMLANLMSGLTAQGRTLDQYLDQIISECGNHQNVSRSIVMRGIRGSESINQMMRSLRENPPTQIGELPVHSVHDHLSAEFGPILSDTDRLSRNLLVFKLEHAQVVIRPSGTEPKAKVYVDLAANPTAPEADRSRLHRAANKLASDVVKACIGRIGVSLSNSASLLPDYVDLELKVDFDKGFRHDLSASGDMLGRLDDSSKLDWLRERLAAYASGSDPLDTTSCAVSQLCEELYRETSNPRLQQAMRDLRRVLTAHVRGIRSE